MSDDLLYYYERELSFLRRMGAEFAQKYPKVASRLQLEPNKCEDPHVERLLEGFAFLAARVHVRLDDDFSEISEALLNLIYPHYVRPIPSLGLVEFELDPDQAKITSGLSFASASGMRYEIADATFVPTVTTPEPASVGLLAAGALPLAVGAARRRRVR